MSTLSLRLPNSLHDEVKSLAKKEGISINQFISSAVAEKMGTNKSSISRLECGEKISFPTLATLSKYANALGYKINVEFEPIQ